MKNGQDIIQSITPTISDDDILAADQATEYHKSGNARKNFYKNLWSWELFMVKLCLQKYITTTWIHYHFSSIPGCQYPYIKCCHIYVTHSAVVPAQLSKHSSITICSEKWTCSDKWIPFMSSVYATTLIEHTVVV